jgi:multiple sugar transport system ATP-binding protein
MLELRGIVKRFGSTPVLRDVDLSIGQGEFVAVVGPSGCGKSTLLRVIAGLENPDEGTVRIDGSAVENEPPKARDVAMVFQSYALYPHMTVEQNMALPLVMRQLTRFERLPLVRRFSRRVLEKRAAIAATVRDTASLVAMTPYLDRKPKQLSGGQRQRVALARALVRKPKLFLLDEPLSNLDAALRATTRTEIVELQKRLGITTIFVTHDQVEAMTMATRIVVLMDGAVVQTGSPQELYEAPTDIRVAQFIGSPAINMVAGHIDGGFLRLPGVAHAIGRIGMANGAVQVGVRPEHVLLANPGPGRLSAVVSRKEFLGSEELLHIVLAGSGIALIARHASDAPSPAFGASVGVKLKADRILIFGEDGQRLAIGVADATPQRHDTPLAEATG